MLRRGEVLKENAPVGPGVMVFISCAFLYGKGRLYSFTTLPRGALMACPVRVTAFPLCTVSLEACSVIAGLAGGLSATAGAAPQAASRNSTTLTRRAVRPVQPIARNPMQWGGGKQGHARGRAALWSRGGRGRLRERRGPLPLGEEPRETVGTLRSPMGELGAFLKIHRVGFDKRDPRERVADHRQYFAVQPDEQLRLQGARCMDCGIPFCHEGCPLGNLIPDWNDLVYRDKWREAIDQLHATNNFPEFTGASVRPRVSRRVCSRSTTTR